MTNTWSSAGAPGFWSTSNAFFASPCYIKRPKERSMEKYIYIVIKIYSTVNNNEIIKSLRNEGRLVREMKTYVTYFLISFKNNYKKTKEHCSVHLNGSTYCLMHW